MTKLRQMNTCDAEGCDAKSEWYKFCYECHQKGIEQGFLVCTDGYKQTIRRRNSKTKDKTEVKEADNYGFNSKQIEGLSALGQHLAAQIQDNANLGGVQAHQVDPFKAPTMTQGLSEVSYYLNVWARYNRQMRREQSTKTSSQN